MAKLAFVYNEQNKSMIFESDLAEVGTSEYLRLPSGRGGHRRVPKFSIWQRGAQVSASVCHLVEVGTGECLSLPSGRGGQR